MFENLFEDFKKWKRGEFECLKCGKTYEIWPFGFGKVICSNCYAGEESFIFYDPRFFLNRLIAKLCGHPTYDSNKYVVTNLRQTSRLNLKEYM